MKGIRYPTKLDIDAPKSPYLTDKYIFQAIIFGIHLSNVYGVSLGKTNILRPFSVILGICFGGQNCSQKGGTTEWPKIDPFRDFPS